MGTQGHDDDDDDDRDLERSLRRRRAENEQLQLEAENVRLQIQIQKDMIQLAALQGEGQIQIQEDISRLARLQGERGRRKAPCSECPKSGGPQACPECSPLNFCFLTEHGNSRDDPSAKTMCPKCSPQNFCRDAEHGQSEESPAHKSSCKKCSMRYFRVWGRRSVDPGSTKFSPEQDEEEGKNTAARFLNIVFWNVGSSRGKRTVTNVSRTARGFEPNT